MKTTQPVLQSDEDFFRALARPRKILLIEDDEQLASAFQSSAANYNAEVHWQPNGRKAISQFFTQGPYDLVMLDLRLPDIDGAEIYRVIREVDKDTRIYVLSGFIDDVIRCDLSQFGMVTFIEKPAGLMAPGGIDMIFSRIGAKRIFGNP